jgi:CHAD domain-containing protein
MRAFVYDWLSIWRESRVFVYFGSMEPLVQNDLGLVIWNFFQVNRDIVLSKVKVSPGGYQDVAVHELRVATKKIRAVYRLCQEISKGDFKAKSEMTELRTLFRAAGTLRELQVDQIVLESYEQLHLASYCKLSKLLLKERRAASPRYQAARKAFQPKSFALPTKKIVTLLENTSADALSEAVIRLAQLRLEEAFQAMPLGYEPEMIHKARIFLKEAMYLIGLLHSANYRSDFDTQRLTDAKFAAEIAGDWHDREVFFQWLQIQLRSQTIVHKVEKNYSILFQDLNVNTRGLVKRFREAMQTMHSPTNSSPKAGQ